MSRRTVGWIVAGVVGLNALLWLVDYLAPGPSGRPSSSLATTPRGFSAWAELAQRNGIRVLALRDELRAARLPAGGTVVALDVPGLPRADARALGAFAARGGHVVAGGRRTPAAVRALGGADGVTLLADSARVQNAHLAQGDNAAFALRLAGRGPLVFAESAHGYGTARGLAALPANAKGALVLLALALLVLMLARGRRFGPVEPAARDLPPPRAAYVDALAARLRR